MIVPTAVKKVLVVRFSSIGDIIHMTPVFRCMKKDRPDISIHFLTKKSMAPLTAHNPHIDRFHYYDDNWEELLDELKNEAFDFVVDLHAVIRSKRVVKALGKPHATIDKLSVKKILLTTFKLNLMPERHISLRALDAVSNLAVKDDGGGLDIFIPEEAAVPLNDIPASHQLGFVAVVIGAAHATKKMPAAQLRDLCMRIQYPVILIGGKEDAEEGKLIAEADPMKIYNSCGKFSLLESADLLRKSKLVVSHDTGMLYIACALRKPTLAIWGATSPKLAVEPYYGSVLNEAHRSALYENICLDLWCQPCSKYGGKKCPLGHFKCMRKLDTAMIAAKVHHRLGLLG